MTKQQRKILIKIIIGAVLFAVGMVVTHLLTLPWWAELLIFLAVYLVPGFSVLEKAVRNIAHGQVFDENFLMTIASIAAFAIGQYPEAVEVILFYQVGELFEKLPWDVPVRQCPTCWISVRTKPLSCGTASRKRYW